MGEGGSGANPAEKKKRILSNEKWKFLPQIWGEVLSRDLKSQNLSYLGGYLPGEAHETTQYASLLLAAVLSQCACENNLVWK